MTINILNHKKEPDMRLRWVYKACTKQIKTWGEWITLGKEELTFQGMETRSEEA